MWHLGIAAALALSACSELSGHYKYKGERRLSERPLDVSTVFWPRDGAVVFGVDRSGERATMHLVPVSGSGSCEAGPVNRYAAVPDERGFRLALHDSEAGRISFHDEQCRGWQPDLRGVDGLSIRRGPDGWHFLLDTEDGALHIADPYLEEVRLVAERVVRKGAGILHPRDADALWLQSGRTLRLVDVYGAAAGPTFESVDDFETYQGVGSDLAIHALLAVERTRVEPHMGGLVELRDLRLLDVSAAALDGLDGTDAEPETLWSELNACSPRFHLVASSCAGEGCEDALEGDLDVVQQVPWVSFRAPCPPDSATETAEAEGRTRDLILRTDTEEPRIVIEGPIVQYRIMEGALDGLPVIIYRQSDGDPADWVAIAGRPPISLGVRVDIGSVRVLGDAPLLSFLSADDSDLMLWSPERGLDTIAEGVRGFSLTTGLMLRDYAGGVGRLSRCVGQRCFDLAEGVPRDAYRSYDTYEPFDDGVPQIAYLHGVAEDEETGVLSVRDELTGRVVDVAEGVASFEPVEALSARGLVYSVPSGERMGLWYAPR